ncbi:hypothetical protein IAG25_17860 [Caballeronia sp. EK]|uniref:hypothetical protein n=1 Tax=Caballeronia sp. EK TaxID=2767469 RepID=UPI001654FADD|nr:hypothetical protein [Caballeronia sp. EK]MBC8638685.1 hypothetical protein [Caballeronia sp. EK]
MSKLLLSVFTAIGVLSACTTDTGITYTARKLNVAQQPQAYRVTCSGIFESQKSCMSEASRICKNQQVMVVEALNNPKLRPGGSSARELNFTCAGGSPSKPAA